MIIKNVKIYAEDKTIENGYVVIENGLIKEIGEGDISKFDIDGRGLNLLPGFIDIHIHGANGVDFMDADFKKYDKMSKSLVKEGTTSFLGTTITQTVEKLSNALKKGKEYIDRNEFPGAKLVGVHFEGPFIEVKMKGAQPGEFIVDSSVEQMKKYVELSGNNIRVVTLAPEKNGAIELIEYLSKNRIVPSAGHSNASYDEMKKAVEHGLIASTHTYNGSKGIHHRDLGVTGSAMIFDEIKCELICDGIHVSEPAIELLNKCKKDDSLILITDSMSAKYLSDGKYDLGGQEVTVVGQKATLKDGTIAGSVLKFNEGLKRYLKATNSDLRKGIKVSSENAAKQIGMFETIGSIKVGKKADVIIVDNDINVFYTMVNGKEVYKK